MRRLPTVNDLRVRECYICREEEVYDKPARPPKRWVHPCKCTLIAHEECLLEWIRASENNPDKPLSNILKCPQCGERYDLESENPLVLRALDFGNRIIQSAGTAVSVLSVAVGVTAVGTGIYMFSTAYGLYAVRSLIGKEMYDLTLGDDVEKWPFPAFITLPLIPFSLVLSKTKRFRDTLPLTTLMSLWPSLPRISGVPRQQGFLSLLGIGSRAVPQIKLPASANRIASDLFRDLIFSWPPSPFVFNIGLKLARSTYNRRLEEFRRSVLGDALDNGEIAAARNGFVEEFRMEVQFEEREEDEQGDEEPDEPHEPPAPAIAANGQADQLRDDNNVRLLLENAEEVPVAADVRPAELILVDARPQLDGQQQAAPPNPARRAEDILAGRARQVNPPANQEPNQREEGGGNAAARVRLQMTSTYIGSIVGSALIVPPLASFAGSTLLRLALPQKPNAHATLDFRGCSRFSPRRLLCRFLGVRPPGSAPKYSISGMYYFGEDMSPGQLMRAMFLISCRAMVIGTPAWTESDPVWWRNAVGLGILYVAKDMFSIWYQYLSQREIRSRRVKDRAFDIDPAQLDLKPESREVFQDAPHSG